MQENINAREHKCNSIWRENGVREWISRDKEENVFEKKYNQVEKYVEEDI